MRVFLAIVVALLLSACGGYKPAPVYADELFDGPVIIKVKLDPEDPSSGVYLQDNIAQLAVNRLNLDVTKDAKKAKNYIVVNDYAINTSPSNSDENGNVIRYSVNAAIVFAVKDKQGFWSKNIVANEYVDVAAQSALGSVQKEEAARMAIDKALDEFVVAVIQRTKKFKSEKAAAKKSQKSKKDSSSAPAQKAAEVASKAMSEVTATTQEEPEVVQESVENQQISVESEETTTVDTLDEQNVVTTSPIPTKEDKIFNAQDLSDPLAQLRE